MRVFKTIVFLLGIYLLTGCGSQKQTINRFYVIEKPDSTQKPIDRQIPSIDAYCEIAPLHIYPAYASQEIANRSNSHEIIYYTSHHWAARPGESLTLLVKDYLDHASVFKGVSTRFWMVNPSYKLTTTVYKLEVVEKEEKLLAHVNLKFKLFNNSNRELLLSHQADRYQTLQRKDMNLFAESIASMFYEELDQLSKKIDQELPKKQQ